MTASPATYCVTPSSENRAYHSNIHEAGVDGGELNSTSERIPNEAQTKWTYFLLGCATLLPWNALTNASLFFFSRLAGSPFYPTFISYWSSAYMVTKLVCQFYCTFTSKLSSPSRRILMSMIAMTLLVTSLCLSTFVRGTPSTFFAFALFIAASVAVADGYLCTAAYAGAALLGTSCLRIMFSGQAAIGVFVSAVQVASSMIALWGLSPKSVSMDVMVGDDHAEDTATRILFGVSAVFLCITLFAYTRLTRQYFCSSATGALDHHRRAGDVDELTQLLPNDRRNPSTEPNSRVYQVLRRNLIFMFSIVYVFVVTLAVAPPITAHVRPLNPRIHPLLFTAVHFLVFHIGDLLGRHSCSFPCLLVWSGKKILTMSLLRTLFIPLILLCNVDRLAATTPVLPIIHSDILFMLIVLTMGYTNGYVATLALLAVSSLKHNPRLHREDVDVAGTLGGSCIAFGLTVGALCSFGVQAMI
ncbi:hypothetical protein OG21DRAFT_1423952 [Imleria badia]|nr:hypothetical protein OG21DRAFT_1423952 [Imleria badia]